MRIEPEQQIAARTRQPQSARGTDKAFASTLAAARDASVSSTATTGTERPLAEQWGQWGQGATPAGFGPPPDPAQFAQQPTGPGAGAHPLNPKGDTTANPAFTVPGYTVRGTPIPPGFYNLAYYNQYLAEGGTPLEGFEAYDPANGSLTDVYGTFGDGRERATSFASGLVTDSARTPASAATVIALARTSNSEASPTTSTERAAASVAAPTPGAAEVAANRRSDPPPATALRAASGVTPADTPATIDSGMLLTNGARDAVRLALQTLLDDLLSIA